MLSHHRSLPRRWLPRSLVVAVFIALPALAGEPPPAVTELGESIDRSGLFLGPELGIELVRALGDELQAALNLPQQLSSAAMAVGAVAGYRFGLLSLGARFQHSSSSNTNYSGLTLNKVYAELGIDRSWPRVGVGGFLDFGYANLAAFGNNLNGIGGKLGGKIEFHAGNRLSLGPVASFDLHGYFGPPTPGVGGGKLVVGTTLMARLALQL